MLYKDLFNFFNIELMQFLHLITSTSYLELFNLFNVVKDYHLMNLLFKLLHLFLP